MARAILLLAALLLLPACTLSDSLLHEPVRSVWGRGAPPPAQALFFATDRQKEGDGFGLKWDATLRCGRAVLAIPDGADLSPNRPDPALDTAACGDARAMAAFMADVARAAKPCGRLLLIVHGYNTTFHTALLQGAQVALDTQWPCATLLFSWSSEGRFDRYAADIERSSFAVPPLLLLLRAARGAGLEINILAHSMGARVIMSAMGALCQEHEPETPSVGQLILAAPDVGADAGNDDFAHLLTRAMPCIRRATVYASDYDLALLTSRSIHGGAPRAGGDPGAALQYMRDWPGVGGAQEVDVIDAGLAPGGPVGHGYFDLSYEMAADMEWALAGKPVAERAGAGGMLSCTDLAAAPCSSPGGGRYALTVAEDRRPGLWTWLLRRLWPISSRVP